MCGRTVTSRSASTTTSPARASTTTPPGAYPIRTSSCLFYGLGSDGTVGANKNSAKIIAEEAGRYVQAYFVYDSKKSGAVTVSHLRFGDDPIDAPYLIEEADFVACHQFQLLERLDVLEHARRRRDRSCSRARTAPTAGGDCRGPSRSRSSTGSYGSTSSTRSGSRVRPGWPDV